MASSQGIQLKAISIVLIVVGVVLAGLSVMYFVTPADALPAFLPGHQAGSTHHHAKHGLATGTLAVVAFIGAWMTSAPKKDSSPPVTDA